MKERMYCLPLRENVSAKVVGVRKTKRGYMLQGEHKHKGKTLNLSKVCNKAKAKEVAKELGITIAAYKEKAKDKPKKAVAAAEEVEEPVEEEVDITIPDEDVEDPLKEEEADQKVKEIVEEITDLKKEGKDEESQVIKDLEKEKEYFVEVKIAHAEESLETEEATPVEEPAVESTEAVETPELEAVIPEVEQYPEGAGRVIGSYTPLADFAPSMHAETQDGMEEFELDFKLFDRVRSHPDWKDMKQFAKVHFEDGGVVTVSVPHFEVDHFLDLVLEAQDFPTLADPETGEEDFVAWIERYQAEHVVEKSTGISKNTLALGGTLIAGLAIGLAWWNSGRRKGEQMARTRAQTLIGIPINWIACNDYRINAGPIDHLSILTWAMFMDQIDPLDLPRPFQSEWAGE